jgi:hypothetical protein
MHSGAKLPFDGHASLFFIPFPPHREGCDSSISNKHEPPLGERSETIPPYVCVRAAALRFDWWMISLRFCQNLPQRGLLNFARVSLCRCRGRGAAFALFSGKKIDLSAVVVALFPSFAISTASCMRESKLFRPPASLTETVRQQTNNNTYSTPRQNFYCSPCDCLFTATSDLSRRFYIEMLQHEKEKGTQTDTTRPNFFEWIFYACAFWFLYLLRAFDGFEENKEEIYKSCFTFNLWFFFCWIMLKCKALLIRN